MVDCPIELLGDGGKLFVGVPFRERLVCLQAEVLQRRENPETER